MTHLQRHGFGSRLYVDLAGTLARDKAVSRVSYDIDMGLWSKRKRKIVADALAGGITTCGAESAALASDLAESVGSSVVRIAAYGGRIYTEEVSPDKLDELVAFTAAWARLCLAQQNRDRGHAFYATLFLKCLGDGAKPPFIPVDPSMARDQARDFYAGYIRTPDMDANPALRRLVEAVRAGEVVTVEGNRSRRTTARAA